MLMRTSSDSADGHTVTNTAPLSVAIGTNGLLIGELVGPGDSVTTICRFLTNAQGEFDFNVSTASQPLTWYLVLCKPDGSIVVSPAISFT